MRKIDYTLHIKGEGKTYDPRPEFINPINNSNNKIFEITADNSYGKTFILNLLAYALEADKLDEAKILDSIRNSITRYDNDDSYELEYNINLELPGGKELKLLKEKKGGKLIKLDDGPPIGHANLHNELSVIYDVPTNPSERLDSVIKDLGQWNKNLENKFDSLSEKIHDITKDFDSVRSEEKIQLFKDKIDETKLKIEEIKKLKAEKKTVLDDLEILSSLNDLKLLLKKKMDLESKIHKKNKQLKSIPKPSKIEKKDENKIRQLNIEIQNQENIISHNIAGIISIISEDENILDYFKENITYNKHYEFVKNTNFKNISDPADINEISDSFEESIKEIMDALNRFMYEKQNSKDYVINNSFERLIEIVEEMMENDIYHLFKEVTSVEAEKIKGQFESVLSNYKIKDYSSLQQFLKKDIAKTVKASFVQIFRTLGNLNKEKSKKMVDDDGSKYYRLVSELKDLDNKFKTVNDNYESKRYACANKIGIKNMSEFNSIEMFNDSGHPIKQKFVNKELLSDIRLSIEELKNDIKKIDTNIDDEKSNLGIYTTKYEREDSRKPSLYNDDQKKKIKQFLQYLYMVNSNMRSFNDLISNIEKNNLSGFKDKEDLSFIELAGKIIAYSMDNKLLRAEGNYINLEYYDMLNQQFHCSDNIIINKADVSTGLASANYLKQRIENVEGKYVVVLLDEIGNMAKNAIDKVIESLKKLENQNRLVLAVLTRPNSNGIEVIEY